MTLKPKPPSHLGFGEYVPGGANPLPGEEGREANSVERGNARPADEIPSVG